MTVVRTVLGDIAPSELGRVDYHEHLFQRSPLLPGDDLDDEARSGTELGILKASGFDAMIDATPVGLGRRPEALARLSLEWGVRVVATTGLHRDAHYSDQAWALDVTEWGPLFTRELTVGIATSDADYAGTTLEDVAVGGVRAGLLKAGIDYWSITPSERRVLEGITVAHAAPGAPVMVHTEECSAALEVLELLRTLGVASRRVVIAHADRNPDPGLHVAIAQTGAYVGYDGAGRHRNWPDSVLIDSLAAVAEAGFAGHVLLGADVAWASRYRSYGGMPGLGYLGTRFLPRLVERLGSDAVHMIVVDNAASFLTWATDNPVAHRTPEDS